jgi:hypothetical protein
MKADEPQGRLTKRRIKHGDAGLCDLPPSAAEKFCTASVTATRVFVTIAVFCKNSSPNFRSSPAIPRRPPGATLSPTGVQMGLNGLRRHTANTMQNPLSQEFMAGTVRE